MINEKSLVIYKNRPALVSGFDGDKINISCPGGDTLKVREKDLEVIFKGPCVLKDLEAEPSAGEPPKADGDIREVWELLSENNSLITLKELAELAYGNFSPATALAAYELLKDGLFFAGSTGAITTRSPKEVEDTLKKREEKQRDSGERAAFLEKLKKLPPYKTDVSAKLSGENLSPSELRFLSDAEAMALGKTSRSRTLKDLGKSETPEEAHRLLLAAGAWTVWINPHPSRFGFGRDSAKSVPLPPPLKERLDMSHLPAYAIDNYWSEDPDDAVSLEGPDSSGRYCLWVHVADPASSIVPESPADKEAMDRGATLYLPEGASRMIADEALIHFALGLKPGGLSPALSFKLTLKSDLVISDVEIIPAMVKIKRLSYAEADALVSGGAGNDASVLGALAAVAERNVQRRRNNGAVMIELPDAHIDVRPGESTITVEPVEPYRSADMIRECMILAGEGAAQWAIQRRLPFPFIGHEAGELPEKILPGLAGAWQLRRCMRPRNLSTRPSAHRGLGLEEYTQVSSPLRRYTDLLCHHQIRAFLKGGKPLSEDEVLFKANTAEAAAAEAAKAERASRSHWLAVYLAGKSQDTVWDGLVLDRKGSRGVVIIPSLGLETQVSLRGSEEPNDNVKLKLLSVRIPEGEALFGSVS